MSAMHPQACPECGGEDRYVYIPRPRDGRDPFWWCRQCRHTSAPDPNTAGTQPAQRILSPAEIDQAQRGYTAAARWCAGQLWQPGGANALAYLHGRGFTDATIRAAGLGWHPDTGQATSSGLGDALYTDHDAYTGAGLGGLLGPQGKAKNLLRGAITLPYSAAGTVAMLRTRMLDPKGGPRYQTPAGLPFYAGGVPRFFLHDDLAGVRSVILTEGELKALAVRQAWQDKALSVPAVAQPGIGYLPDALLDDLSHKTVYLCYDSEARRDPFQESPGERYTRHNGERLTGAAIERHRAGVAAQLRQAHKAKDSARIVQLEARDRQLEQEAQAAQARGIVVRVLRLPRPPGVAKVDLDSFLLEHGPAALQALIDAAPTFTEWTRRHNPGAYRYESGGISNGQALANYRAVIAENVTRYDGIEKHGAHRLIIESPDGTRHERLIDDDIWADDRKARQALLQATLDGTAWHEPDALRAIKMLSTVGDGPAKRTAYACTGWERIGEHWQYLMPDGAISAAGVVPQLTSELPANTQGNHYALAQVPGDPALGALAFKRLLFGEAGAQPLALVLAAHAALALVHRFTGDSGRPLVYPYGESGTYKTSFTRIFLSLYGPHFTAEGRDGKPIPKWNSTANGLERILFDYRDTLVCIDDYKQATAQRDALPKFLHNYSEGASRARMTHDRKADRVFTARGMAIITGEDRPTGDTGQLARVLLVPVGRGDIRPDVLSELQRAGADGHLAAFWRQFVQFTAQALDRLGADGLEQRLAGKLRTDDATLPGHQRTAGTLRQNRAAWLALAGWMHHAGYLTADEQAQLNAAHLEARRYTADEQAQAQRDERPSAIYLNTLRELLATGAAVLKDDADAGEAPPPPERIIGFRYKDAIALYPMRAWAMVHQQLGRSPLLYSQNAVYEQLKADGHLADTDRKNNRTTKQVWDGKGSPRVLLVRAEALEGPPDPEPITPPITHNFQGVRKSVMQDSALGSPITDNLTHLTHITPTETNIQTDTQASALHDASENMTPPLQEMCKGVRNADIRLSDALENLTHIPNEMCKEPRTAPPRLERHAASSPRGDDGVVRRAADLTPRITRENTRYVIDKLPNKGPGWARGYMIGIEPFDNWPAHVQRAVLAAEASGQGAPV